MFIFIISFYQARRREAGKLKVRVGWRHNGAQVACRYGGGSHAIDLQRELTLPEVVQFLLDFFLPGGSSLNGVKLCDITSTDLTLFNGTSVPGEINAKPSRMDSIVQWFTTSPVRFYLSTISDVSDKNSLVFSVTLNSASYKLQHLCYNKWAALMVLI